MPFSSANLASSLSLYSIPVVWFTGFYPFAWKLIAVERAMGYDTVQPRSNISRVKENKNIRPAKAARIERMDGAHQNGNETFPVWAAAVLTGHLVGLNDELMNKMSIAFILTRILYNQVYIGHETQGGSVFRTALYFVSISMPLTLLVKAANKLAGSH